MQPRSRISTAGRRQHSSLKSRRYSEPYKARLRAALGQFEAWLNKGYVGHIRIRHLRSTQVADKVLEIVERENLVERAATMGGKLRQRLLRFESHPNVAEVRGIGLLMALELVADRDTGASFPKSAGLANAVVSAGIAEGAFFYPSGTDPARDIITLGPPFTVSESELDDLAAILEKSIDTAVGRIAA